MKFALVVLSLLTVSPAFAQVKQYTQQPDCAGSCTLDSRRPGAFVREYPGKQFKNSAIANRRCFVDRWGRKVCSR